MPPSLSDIARWFQVFPVAYNEFEENLLMCAPTGAGKTNVAMLTIMNVLRSALLVLVLLLIGPEAISY